MVLESHGNHTVTDRGNHGKQVGMFCANPVRCHHASDVVAEAVLSLAFDILPKLAGIVFSKPISVEFVNENPSRSF